MLDFFGSWALVFFKKWKITLLRKRSLPYRDPQRLGWGAGWALQGDFPSSRWRYEPREHLSSTRFSQQWRVTVEGREGGLSLGVAILKPDPRCGRRFPFPRDR